MALDTSGVVGFIKAHPYASGGLVLAVIVGTWVLTSPKSAPAQSDASLMGGGLTYQVGGGGSSDVGTSMQIQAMDKQMAFARDQMTAQGKLQSDALSAQLKVKELEITSNFDIAKLMAGVQQTLGLGGLGISTLQVQGQIDLGKQSLGNDLALGMGQIDLTKYLAELSQNPVSHVANEVKKLYGAVGRTPTSADLTYWGGDAIRNPNWVRDLTVGLVQDAPKMNTATGGSMTAAEAQVRQLYASKGIANPDAAGLAYWTKEAAAGIPIVANWNTAYAQNNPTIK